jgi:hypothetical protein
MRWIKNEVANMHFLVCTRRVHYCSDRDREMIMEFTICSKKLGECGNQRSQLRGALMTVEYWATDVPDDKLRERMDLIKRYVSEAKQIGG